MTFAFLVHPRADLRRDLALLFPPLGLLPGAACDIALRRLPLPPVRLASVSIGGRAEGTLLMVPFGAHHLLARPGEGLRRIREAVDRAARAGAHVVGLGGLTSPVSAGGVAFRRRTDVGVTTGNSFTAAVVHRQLSGLLASAPEGRVAIVGATGSVGGTVARLLARDRAAAELVLVARGRARLESLRAELSGPTPVRTASLLDDIAGCDVVVLLTAAADTVLRPHHLAACAVVLDATQPRNTSPDLLRRRPDVTLMDGGVVSVPSMLLRGGSIGLPAGQAFACLAETMLLSLAGHRGHFALGRPGLDQVAEIDELAGRFAPLGFVPAPPSTFGRPSGKPALSPRPAPAIGVPAVPAAVALP